MKLIMFVCLALFSNFTAAQDITGAFVTCANTKDNRERLACYDKLRADLIAVNSQPQKKDQYSALALADLKPDIKTLRGKKVSVKGYIQTIGPTSMLKTDPVDMSPVFADTDSLPREDRKKLLNGCQMVMCSGAFYGTVRDLPMGPGLVLEKVSWN